MTSTMRNGDARTFSTWKLVGWTLAGFAAMFVAMIALGYLAAHLDHGTGARVWKGRLVPVAAILLVLPVVGAGAVVWRRSRRIEAQAPPGEARAARRSRSFWTTLGVQTLVGLCMGFTFAYFHDGHMPRTLPSVVGIGLAIVYAVGTIWGSIALLRTIDELEMQDNLWSGYCAAGTICLVYPPWYLLWWSALIPEPSHEILFLLLVASMMAAYFGRKLRR